MTIARVQTANFACQHCGGTFFLAFEEDQRVVSCTFCNLPVPVPTTRSPFPANVHSTCGRPWEDHQAGRCPK